ncbi:MAG: response regulator [Chloroflexi bacterium]|nr:MAG: response regulator [Chloroflexota bacterium]
MTTILVVDDHFETREFVSVALEVAGPKLLFAETGQEALRLAVEQHPDIVLLDIKLRHSPPDGLDVCRLLKQNPDTCDIYIIIMSARVQEDDIKAARNAGADDYLPKPFGVSELLEKIFGHPPLRPNGGG